MNFIGWEFLKEKTNNIKLRNMLRFVFSVCLFVIFPKKNHNPLKLNTFTRNINVLFFLTCDIYKLQHIDRQICIDKYSDSVKQITKNGFINVELP